MRYNAARPDWRDFDNARVPYMDVGGLQVPAPSL